MEATVQSGPLEEAMTPQIESAAAVDADMADRVRSLSEGGLHHRIAAYRAG